MARTCGHETRRGRCERRENNSGRQSGLRGDAFGHSECTGPDAETVYKAEWLDYRRGKQNGDLVLWAREPDGGAWSLECGGNNEGLGAAMVKRVADSRWGG